MAASRRRTEFSGAASLVERLIERRGAGAMSSRGTHAFDRAVASRLEAWCSAAADGDSARFERRLIWDGLDIEAAREILASPSQSSAASPEWAILVQEAIAESLKPAPRCAFLDPDQPLPFEEVLLPFVLVARQRLAGAYDGDLVSNSAQQALERQLLRELSDDAAEALYLELSLRLAGEGALYARFIARAPGAVERRVYTEMVEQLRGDELASVFDKYPVLARLLGTTMLLSTGAQAEMLERLRADRPALEAQFGPGLGRVEAIEPGLSDPHHGRRTVTVLTFTSGARIVYKPKNLGIDSAFEQIAAWLRLTGAPHVPHVPGCLDRDTYGWVEYVNHQPCRNEQELSDYFTNAGGLLALLYALVASDCHSENVIAHGDRPVLVDLETLAQPHMRSLASMSEEAAEWQVAHVLEPSVLWSAFLPNWLPAGEDRFREVGGLGVPDHANMRRVVQWRNINTDGMYREWDGDRATALNSPWPVGLVPALESYIDQVISGFSSMYRFLLKHRTELLAPGGPIEQLAGRQVRHIHRNTRVYRRLLEQARAPEHLHHGIDRGIVLERLARGLATDDAEREFLWPVLRAEQQAMEQGDIPCFVLDTLSTDLAAGTEAVSDCFTRSGYRMVVDRIASLSEDDLRQQTGLIRAAFVVNLLNLGRELPRSNSPSAESGVRASPYDLLARTVEIAEVFHRRAVHGLDGSVTWLTLSETDNGKMTRIGAPGYDLYGGLSGVGLFMAALYLVTGESRHRDLALASARTIASGLASGGEKMAARLGIGGMTGLPSIVYSLAQISRLTDEPEPLRFAGSIAGAITAQSIAEDTRYDVMAGSAGACLGLLALYALTRDDDALQKALLCGQKLIEARTATATGHRSWRTVNGKHVCGFSHGAAGIAYALLRLYAVSAERAFCDAAEEAIAYEDALYMPDAENWPDLRAEVQPAFMTSWCHGAPGIGLGRLGSMTAIDTPQVRHDIEVAIGTTQSVRASPMHHLCCGTLGRAEFLLMAGERLHRPDLVNSARQLAASVVDTAPTVAGVSLAEQEPLIYVPGFFRGLSGIGYELLRLALPGRLACVLTLEAAGGNDIPGESQHQLETAHGEPGIG